MAAKKSVFNEENFIPGVFNYCNSWCERCRFRLRCRNYAMMADEEGNLIDLDDDGAIERIEENMRKAMGLLKSYQEEEHDEEEEEQEEDEDMDEPDERDQAEWMAEMEREKEFARNHPLAKLTMSYSNMARSWLEAHDEQLKRKVARLKEQSIAGPEHASFKREHDELADAIEVVQWYVFMIHVKTQRALHGLKDMNDEIWESPLQSDANGSAKVALLSAEATMSAWVSITELMPEVLDEILPMLSQLQQTIMGLLKVFPEARRFVRPGFDE